MSSYSITTIRPPGFAHSSCFRHVQESLTWALAALGHEATIAADNFLDSDAGVTNIIFGCELLQAGTILPKNCIVYNLEQARGHAEFFKLTEIIKASNVQVWDYSLTGVEYWESRGIDVRHVSIGYTPNLTRIPTDLPKDYDVMFYGWLTPRRAKILEELQHAGLKVAPVVGPNGYYGGGLDNLIARSKMVVNIHHDGRTQFEIVRVAYLLANAKCVVSEVSSDDAEYEDCFLIRAAYDNLVDVCDAMISTGKFPAGFMEDRDYVATVRAALADQRPQSDESWQGSEAILAH